MTRAALFIAWLALFATSACSAEKPKVDPAIWYLDRGESLTGDSTSFTAKVTRMGCNGGTTGDVLPPQVEYGDKDIVVVFRVTPRQTGDATCQGNNFVPYVVRLAEPIGARALIDGECRGSDGASTTAFCDPDEVRYKP